MNQKSRRVARPAIGAAVGALLGLAYWWQVGCVQGTCPITSSPLLMTLLGAAMGLSLLWPSDAVGHRPGDPSDPGPGDAGAPGAHADRGDAVAQDAPGAGRDPAATGPR